MPGTVEYNHDYTTDRALRGIQYHGTEGSLWDMRVQAHTHAHARTHLAALAAPVKEEEGVRMQPQVYLE